MLVQFLFRKMRTSDALMQSMRERLQFIVERATKKDVEAQVVFFIEGNEKVVQCQMRVKGFAHISAEGRGETMDKAMSKAAARLNHQLTREKFLLRRRRSQRYAKTVANSQLWYDSADRDTIDALDIIKYEEAMRKVRKAS